VNLGGAREPRVNLRNARFTNPSCGQEMSYVLAV